MRVTNSMMNMSLQGNTAAAMDRLQQYQTQLASGKRITRASDDPTGTSRALNLRSARADTEQYAQNVTAAKDYFNRVDSSLGSITQSIQEAKRLGLAGAGDSVQPEQREQLANQVQSQIDSILREVNGTYLNRQIFSGNQTGTVPVVANPAGTPPYQYAGDDGVTRVPVGENSDVQIDLTAKKLLNFDGASDPSQPDVLTVLTGLRDSLQSGDLQGIQDGLKQVDVNYQNVLQMRGAAGVKGQQMSIYSDRLADTKVSLDDMINDVEGVDLTEAYTQLQMEQNTYQASLLATSRMSQTSLADYLR